MNGTLTTLLSIMSASLCHTQLWQLPTFPHNFPQFFTILFLLYFCKATLPANNLVCYHFYLILMTIPGRVFPGMSRTMTDLWFFRIFYDQHFHDISDKSSISSLVKNALSLSANLSQRENNFSAFLHKR